MKKLLKYLLGFTAAAVITTSGAVSASAAVTYGNCSENILNGGILATDDSGKLYYADTEKANRLFAGDQMISNDAAENINVIDNTVYYTTDEGSGSSVISISRTGGMKTEVLTTSQPIEEMYVDSEGTVYYLAGGQVYEREADAEKSTVIAQGSITHFIPTNYGVILAKGSRGSYTICADGQTIRTGVDSFYTYEDYLLFTQNNQDYQVKIHDLFHGFTSAAIQTYSLGDSTAAVTAFGENLTDDDECEECEENAKNGTATLASDADSVAPVAASGVTSMLNSGTISEGQYNIVLRARQQHEVQWTPKKDIKGWGNAYTFSAGTTYSGLPYGQPAGSTGAYTPWKATLVEFVNAVNDVTSKMYTSRSTYNRSAPYYSCDCSSFVSWSWDLPSRQYTGSIAAYATEVTNKSIYSLQVGDALNKSGSHVVLVSDIGYRDDEVVYIDIMEQTPPSTRYTRWGEGATSSAKTLAAFYTKYWGNGYKTLRSKTRDSAEYVPSAAVQLDGEVAPSLANSGVQLSSTTVNINPTENMTYTLTYTKTSSVTGSESWDSSNEKVATVGSTGKITAKSAGMTVISLYIGGALRARSNVYVSPQKVKLTGAKSSAASKMTISWESVPSAAKSLKYEVFRKRADGTWEYRGSSTGTSWTDSGLAGYTSYTYTVRAVATTSNGTTLTGAHDTTGKTALTKMDTPALISLSPTRVTTMKLTWTSVRGASKYLVFRRVVKSTGKKKWEQVGTTTKTKFSEKNLEKGASYTYTVRAVSESGKKSGYNKKGLTAKMTAPTPVLKTLEITGKGTTTLTWKKSKGAIGYAVYRKTGKGKFVQIATVKKTTYEDTGLKYKTKYTYTVRAISKGTTGELLSGYDKKGLAVKMKLPAPELVSATSSKTGQAVVQWEAVKGAEYYMIYYKKDNGKWGTLAAVVPASKTSAKITGLTSGSGKIFTVRAAWKIGEKYGAGYYDTVGRQVTIK